MFKLPKSLDQQLAYKK